MLPKWAAEAALTPTSAGAFGVFRLRTHSSQLLRWSNSPSGFKVVPIVKTIFGPQ